MMNTIAIMVMLVPVASIVILTIVVENMGTIKIILVTLPRMKIAIAGMKVRVAITTKVSVITHLIKVAMMEVMM